MSRGPESNPLRWLERVRVGSMNEPKIEAVRSAFSSYAPSVDVHGAEVVYDLDEPQGVKNSTTLWSTYQDALSTARQLVAKSEESLPAYSSTCKLCHWYSACQARLEETDDLTLIPDLGRSKRDVMVVEIATASDLAEADVSKFITGNKTEFRGIGPDSLHKFHQRAKLVKFDGANPVQESEVGDGCLAGIRLRD